LQRQALLDAARLAGLSVLGLVHSHAAAALQYGIERDFANRTESLVLYDLGAASLQAALVTYSAYTGPRGAATSQFEVRDVVWREDVGGDQLELGEAAEGGGGQGQEGSTAEQAAAWQPLAM
jgi:hypoxia up-regulated 1